MLDGRMQPVQIMSAPTYLSAVPPQPPLQLPVWPVDAAFSKIIHTSILYGHIVFASRLRAFLGGQIVVVANPNLATGLMLHSAQHPQKHPRATKTTICFSSRLARTKACGYKELWRMSLLIGPAVCCLLLPSVCNAGRAAGFAGL